MTLTPDLWGRTVVLPPGVVQTIVKDWLMTPNLKDKIISVKCENMNMNWIFYEFFFFLKFKISCTWFVGMGVSDRVTVGIGRVRWDVGHKQMVSQPPEAPTIGQWYGRHGDVRHGEHAGYRCQWRLGAGCREHDILEIRKRFTSLLVRSIINK